MQYIIPQWKAPKNVKAITTTKNGGYSQGRFSSFNLADHVGDNSHDVLLNRQKLYQDLQISTKPQWLTQIHSDKVIELRSNQIYDKNDLSVDASFTREKQIICGVLTADCLPILLCDKQGTVVASIHAGWKGLAQGIIYNTLHKMSIKPQDILVWFGPAIGPKAFVVDSDVYEIFVNKLSTNINAFSKSINANNKWLADIYILAQNELMDHGVLSENIYNDNYCTFTQEDKFFSYRRDNEITGRIASLIWLNS